MEIYETTIYALSPLNVHCVRGKRPRVCFSVSLEMFRFTQIFFEMFTMNQLFHWCKS